MTAKQTKEEFEQTLINGLRREMGSFIDLVHKYQGDIQLGFTTAEIPIPVEGLDEPISLFYIYDGMDEVRMTCDLYGFCNGEAANNAIDELGVDDDIIVDPYHPSPFARLLITPVYTEPDLKKTVETVASVIRRAREIEAETATVPAP